MKHGALMIALFALCACNGDDDDSPADDTVGGDTARDFTVRIENIAPWTVLRGGTQATKTTLVDGPAAPGEAYQLRFTAAPGQSISFATMLRESNDWFFATGPDGIPLFEGGVAVSGDVTSFVQLWDAGTELDQEPAVGDATGVRQLTRDAGEPDPDSVVREVPEVVQLDTGTAFTRPSVPQMIRVTLTPGNDQQFVLRIENVSNSGTMATSVGRTAIHIAPLAWALHTQPAPLFDPGKVARPNGLELLAEAGQPDALGTTLGIQRGFATPLSPGVVVVGTAPNPLFAPGSADYGVGLERLAEDGDATPLHDSLVASPPDGLVSVTEFTTPVGSEGAAAAQPGQAFEVTVHGEEGQSLFLATMFGMSNDWFFATDADGIALFDRDIPRSCDVTTEVFLFDLGTEADEDLATGPDTAAQQLAPDTGRPDRVPMVREVTVDRYTVPVVMHLRVTLRPQ